MQKLHSLGHGWWIPAFMSKEGGLQYNAGSGPVQGSKINLSNVLSKVLNDMVTFN